jgi:short subunit dehydrogenase-like uncharacterized protein
VENSVLIYGAYGYTGQLIVRRALDRGLRPILAGRNGNKLAAMEKEWKLETRVFGLEDETTLDDGLRGISVVVHCAGPFVATAHAMAGACLRAGAHYVDITGEIEVFETLALMDEAAKKAGVALLPGGGFDVIPSDCLALHLKEQLPTATYLRLAFSSGGSMSHGTTLTVVSNMSRGGAIRKDGRLKRVPAGWKTRRVDFGKGPCTTISIPWGDVSTAYHSTGIPNIEVYTPAPLGMRLTLYSLRVFGKIFSWGPMQAFVQARVPEGGPSDEARARAHCLLWGEVEDAEGNQVSARLRTPEGYDFTADGAVHIAERMLKGDVAPGYQTPASAFGADFVLELEGVEGW